MGLLRFSSQDSSFASALVVRHFSHKYYGLEVLVQLASTSPKVKKESGREYVDVHQIIVEKEKAVGVEMKDGEKIYAPNIVSATRTPTNNHCFP